MRSGSGKENLLSEICPPQHDLALLRQFEPVLRYTRGERFFPIDVNHYIPQCSLWIKPVNAPAELLIPQGQMCMEELVRPRLSKPDSIYYLKFIEPPDLIALAKYSLDNAVRSFTSRVKGEMFRAGHGRLSRVGYGSRFVDALFSLSLVWRGRVPGDTAAAAALAYESIQQLDPKFYYYGRVVRENGWVILQYWYFYPFNNWRSGFFGVNDHEADWEMVSIYCFERKSYSAEEQAEEGSYIPQWVGYASHDFSGDDLRRRWDDPEVEKVGDHPIVYAGAGSHASYYSSGEYMAELELPFLTPLIRLVDKGQELWYQTLKQAGSESHRQDFNVFRIPFVDYARGDGMSIGPGQNYGWEALILDENTPWAVDYRGLWGLFAQDPISGENAPAGPVYNRDGTVRRCWYDPLGWAGLDKVPPLSHSLEVIEQQGEQLKTQAKEFEKVIQERSHELYRLGIEAQALSSVPHLEGEYVTQLQKLKKISQELADTRRNHAINLDKQKALNEYENRLRQGDPGPLRAHIHRAHRPTPQAGVFNLFGELVAALSVGLLMIGFVVIILLARQYLLFGLSALVGVLIFIEAGFRGQLARLITSLTIGLAVVSVLVLAFEFFWQIVIVGVLIAGIFVIWENILEFRR